MKIFSLAPLLILAVLYFYDPTLILKENLPSRQTAQTLFVAFDGIPFAMVEGLYKEGRLAGYQKPSEMISVFPSTTTACFTGIFRSLGAAKGPGYDAKFFDWKKNQVMGNLLEAYDVGGSSYKKFFSYMRSTGFEQTVMYTAPWFALRVDMARLKPAIWRAPGKKEIYFYFGSTDASAHLDGREATRQLFLEAIAAIERLRKEYWRDFGKELNVVLFSDHGFHWDAMKPIDVKSLEAPLRQKGKFLSQEKLENSDAVAAITWGNISGADFYVMSGRAIPSLASVLMDQKGVDLVFYVAGSGEIKVHARRDPEEMASIYYDAQGKRFSYIPKIGDPLNYLPAVKALKREKKLNAESFASEEDWWEKTKEHYYPDALYRVWDAFFGLAQNPASLLLSTKEDYEFGDNLTRLGAKIRGGLLGTHGALAKNSSSAFVMTTNPEISLPSVVRYDEALNYFPR